MPAPIFGLLNIHKPLGPTSHDIVDQVRRGTRVKKIGHAGTLDPLATGVLVLCLGAATRLSEYIMGSPKTYRAQVHFGVETNTYDAEGEVVAESAQPLTREDVLAALEGFRGEFEQIPPVYSAIKKGGQRLYDRVRAGEDVEVEARPVTIYRLDLLDWAPPVAELEIVCSPGTYIRSLAHDLGQVTGTGAYLAGLVRAASGQFTLEDAVVWDDLAAAMRDRTWEQYLLPADLALDGTLQVLFDAEQAAFVRNGGMVPIAGPSAGLARAYDEAGRFFAVLEPRGGYWKPQKVFRIE